MATGFTNVSIINEDSEKTILTYDDTAGTINQVIGLKYGKSN